MSPGDIFGSIKTGYQLSSAARDTLRSWFPTYLREMEIMTGYERHTFPNPLSYIVVNNFTKFGEDQLPCVMTISPGLNATPMAQGDGNYKAWFDLGVGVVVASSDRDRVEEIAALYIATARAILLQQADLGHFAEQVEWRDEGYDPIASPDNRSLGAAQAAFRVLVGDLVSRLAGPAFPTEPNEDTLPGQPPVVAERVIVDLEKEALDQ